MRALAKKYFWRNASTSTCGFKVRGGHPARGRSLHERSPVLNLCNQILINSKKMMITIFCTGTRLLKLGHASQEQKCNKKYFLNEILDETNEECNHGTGCRITKTMKIQMDNS
jgi:hypothetical protein